jgi:putative transposase
MTRLEDRQSLAQHIDIAGRAGARLHKACEIVGIDLRTLQRWKAFGQRGLVAGDARPSACRPRPSHSFSPAEREHILALVNAPRFAAIPPARIVPMLADEGTYVASESTMARVLKEYGQNKHRGRAKTRRASRRPTTHIATAPNQVWCWDMTYLPAVVMGRWFYLYLILDLFSRKIVGWEVHETDDSHHAANVVRRTALAEKIALMDNKPKLHGDNGATLKAMTVLSMLHWLSIEPSYSRPRVSDDNAYVESLFRTAKYRPEFPAKGFASLEVTRRWADQFVHWYNYEHKHSGIGYVSPAQKHCGQDIAILAARDVVYAEAKRLNPSRWSGATRDWTPIEVVTLNPEKEAVISAHLKAQQSSGREASNNLLHAA